jgi:hypothetical protein
LCGKQEGLGAEYLQTGKEAGDELDDAALPPDGDDANNWQVNCNRAMQNRCTASTRREK